MVKLVKWDPNSGLGERKVRSHHPSCDRTDGQIVPQMHFFLYVYDITKFRFLKSTFKLSYSSKIDHIYIFCVLCILHGV